MHKLVMLASHFDWFYVHVFSVSFAISQSAYPFGFTTLRSKLPFGKFYLFIHSLIYFATSKLQSDTEQKLILNLI